MPVDLLRRWLDRSWRDGRTRGNGNDDPCHPSVGEVVAAWEEGRALDAVRGLARLHPSPTWQPALALLDRVAVQLHRPVPQDPGFDLARAEARQQLNALAGKQRPSEGSTEQVLRWTRNAIPRIAANPRLDWLADELQTMTVAEPSRPLNVAVFGVYSAGKSSLLNALLGDDGPQLPSAMEPATARLTEICWGEEPGVTVIYRDGREAPIAAARMDEVLLQGRGIDEDVVRVRVRWPSELLRDLTLFDTPGFGSEFDRHFEETQHLIAEVDVVWWVFNATKGGSEIEGRELPHLERSAGKSIGLVNQIDAIRPKYRRKPQQWRENLDGVLEDLKDKMGAHIHEWHAVSARWMAEGHPESGREALRATLDALRAQRHEIQRAAVRKRIDEAYSLVRAWEQAVRLEDKRAKEGERRLARLRKTISRGRGAWSEEWVLCKAERRTRIHLPSDAVIERLAEQVLGLGSEPLTTRERVVLARVWQALDALARVLSEPGLGATWSGLLERVAAIRHEGERISPLYWRMERSQAEVEPEIEAWIDGLVRYGAAVLKSAGPRPTRNRSEAPWSDEVGPGLDAEAVSSQIPGTGSAAKDVQYRAQWAEIRRATEDRMLPQGVRWGLALRGVREARSAGAHGVVREATEAERALRPEGQDSERVAHCVLADQGVSTVLTARSLRAELREDLGLALGRGRSLDEVVVEGRARAWSRRWAWTKRQTRRSVRWVAAASLLGGLMLFPSGAETWSAMLAHESMAWLHRWELAVGGTLAHVPAGDAMLGSEPNDPEADPDEPLLSFSLAEPLLVMTTEVTQGQWEAVMGDNPVATRKRRSGGRTLELACGELGLGPDLPVVCVEWEEAVRFANALSEQEERTPAYRIEGGVVHWDREADGYRLPTEEEWEYAARAGASGTWAPAGEASMLCAYANVRDRSTADAHPSNIVAADCDDGAANTAPVASYRPNRFGLHDMLGNVWEWTWPGEAASVPVRGPRGLRGGSWFNGPADVRPANRYEVRSDTRSPWVGVRLVRGYHPEEDRLKGRLQPLHAATAWALGVATEWGVERP